MKRATRGRGIFEDFLARLRIKKVNSLIPRIARSGIILDIGCGSYPLFLLKTFFFEKYGLDKSISKEIVQQLSKKQLSIQKLDIEKQGIPFNENFFDVITMLAVFEHIDPLKLQGVINEIHRALKPGGLFIMTTPAPWSDLILKIMAKLKLVSPEEIYDHKDIYTVGKISSILQKGGFNENNIRSGYFEFGLNIWATAKK